MNNGPFSEADLLINEKGRIYHLDLAPDELAKDIIIVGDPHRVLFIADEFVVEREFTRENRGLQTVTGIVKGTESTPTPHRVTIVTSGMGTPSLEIVVGELIALNEIDFKTRMRRPKKEIFPLNICRSGTSGGLQKTTPLGTPVISYYAIGMDNTGLFYNFGADPKCDLLEKKVLEEIEKATPDGSRFKGYIRPYAALASQALVWAMQESANELKIVYKAGITVSNSGFWANQGRDVLGISLTVPDIDRILAETDTESITGMKIENMEMEASTLFHMCWAKMYNAGAICPAIANRRDNTFDEHYKQNVHDATAIDLRALYKLRFSTI